MYNEIYIKKGVLFRVFFSWGNFYDPESELSHYEICLGKSQGECDEIGNIPLELNTTYALNNLTLRHKEEYYVTVTVSNIAGLSTSVTSNGIKIDRTPPEPIRHMTGTSSTSGSVCNVLFDSCNEETGDLPHLIFHSHVLYKLSHFSTCCNDKVFI